MTKEQKEMTAKALIKQVLEYENKEPSKKKVDKIYKFLNDEL